MVVLVSVAQLVERRIVIPVVAGSNPVVHPNHLASLQGSLPGRRPARIATYPDGGRYPSSVCL